MQQSLMVKLKGLAGPLTASINSQSVFGWRSGTSSFSLKAGCLLELTISGLSPNMKSYKDTLPLAKESKQMLLHIN